MIVLTPSERRGAWIVALLLLIGACYDLLRARAVPGRAITRHCSLPDSSSDLMQYYFSDRRRLDPIPPQSRIPPFVARGVSGQSARHARCETAQGFGSQLPVMQGTPPRGPLHLQPHWN